MERSKSTHPARDALARQRIWDDVPQYDGLQRNISIQSYDSGYGECVSDHSRKVYPLYTPDESRTRIASTGAGRAQSPPLPAPRPSSTHLSSVLLQNPSARNIPVKSSRALVLELWQILHNQDDDRDTYAPLHIRERINNWAHDVSSPRTTMTGPGTSNSPKSSTTTTSISLGDGSNASVPASKRRLEGNDEDEGPSKKKPNEDQDNFPVELLQQPAYSKQMPCPMLELHDCQGTNTTISELFRSLMNRHRIVICKECCARIPIQDDERKIANVLQKHGTGCERRCIGSSCVDGSSEGAPHHRRTEKCPSWATLTKEVRWTFIWTLVNPGSLPPDPEFPPGPAFEHSQERRPCKQQARARGNEICAHLMRDIEAKEKRISALEKNITVAENANLQIRTHEMANLDNQLRMAKNEAELVQGRCREKVVNLENIVEDLLERLNDSGGVIPGSLQRRLQKECPRVMVEVSATFSAKCLRENMQSLPASASQSSHVHYPLMKSSTPNATFAAPLPPPPPLLSTPDISAWQDTASQQVIGSNTRSHYPGFDPTTINNVMGQVIGPSYQHQAYSLQQQCYPPQQQGYPLQQQPQSYNDRENQGYAVGGEPVDSNASYGEQELTR